METAITILTTLLGFISGGGLTALVLMRARRKKADAEAVGEELHNTDTSVETLAKTIALLNGQMETANASIAAKDAIIFEKDKRILELTEEKTALQSTMCIHQGCKLRKPHLGQGDKWLREHRESPTLDVDYLSVEWLLKQYRKKQEAESGADQNLSEGE